MISFHDLMRDFEHRLQAAIGRKIDLGETDTAEFKAWEKKLKTLQNNPRQKDREALKLAGLRERKPQQTQNISEPELKRRLESSWRWYDRLLFQAAQPALQPGLPVRDRESWLLHRAGTALTFSDQIPVWLKPAPGRVLTSVVEEGQAEEAAEEGSEGKSSARETSRRAASCSGSRGDRGWRGTSPDFSQESTSQTSVRSAGEAPRWRVFFIARQAVSKYFSEGEVPTGHIMPSILLVYGLKAFQVQADGCSEKSFSTKVCEQSGSQTKECQRTC